MNQHANRSITARDIRELDVKGHPFRRVIRRRRERRVPWRRRRRAASPNVCAPSRVRAIFAVISHAKHARGVFFDRRLLRGRGGDANGTRRTVLDIKMVMLALMLATSRGRRRRRRARPSVRGRRGRSERDVRPHETGRRARRGALWRGLGGDTRDNCELNSFQLAVVVSVLSRAREG